MSRQGQQQYHVHVFLVSLVYRCGISLNSISNVPTHMPLDVCFLLGRLRTYALHSVAVDMQRISNITVCNTLEDFQVASPPKDVGAIPRPEGMVQGHHTATDVHGCPTLTNAYISIFYRRDVCSPRGWQVACRAPHHASWTRAAPLISPPLRYRPRSSALYDGKKKKTRVA